MDEYETRKKKAWTNLDRSVTDSAEKLDEELE